jgi:protein phosphatase
LGKEAVDALLQSAVKLANFTVYDQAREFADFAGMGTTLVAVLVQGRTATVVNVGDSRLYHVSPGQIRQITRDHSLVQMMVERGELAPERARNYPGKNLITRAIGTEAAVHCDLFHRTISGGDCLLLCSDGLSNLVDEQEILFEVVHGLRKEQCCESLLNIAKNRGAPDNVTCVLVQL